MLETLHEVWGEGRLALGIAAGRLAAGLLGLIDAERVVRQLVGVG